MKDFRSRAYPGRLMKPPHFQAPGWHTLQAACGVGLALLVLALAFAI